METVRNRVLQTFKQVLVLLFDRKYREKFLNADAVMKSVRDHRAMLKLIGEGDEAGLEELIREYIRPL